MKNIFSLALFTGAIFAMQANACNLRDLAINYIISESQQNTWGPNNESLRAYLGRHDGKDIQLKNFKYSSSINYHFNQRLISFDYSDDYTSDVTVTRLVEVDFQNCAVTKKLWETEMH